MNTASCRSTKTRLMPRNEPRLKTGPMQKQALMMEITQTTEHEKMQQQTMH